MYAYLPTVFAFLHVAYRPTHMCIYIVYTYIYVDFFCFNFYSYFFICNSTRDKLSVYFLFLMILSLLKVYLLGLALLYKRGILATQPIYHKDCYSATRYCLYFVYCKVRLSSSKKIIFVCFKESPLK